MKLTRCCFLGWACTDLWIDGCMFQLLTPDSSAASLSSLTIFPAPSLAECCGHWPTHYYWQRGRLLTSRSPVPWLVHLSAPLLAGAKGLTAKLFPRESGLKSILFECVKSLTIVRSAASYSNLQLVSWCHRWQPWLLSAPLILSIARFHVLFEW